MRANRRTIPSLLVVLLLGSTLPSLTSAGEPESTQWAAGAIPVHKIYIPGQGRPPGFAPLRSPHGDVDAGAPEMLAEARPGLLPAPATSGIWVPDRTRELASTPPVSAAGPAARVSAKKKSDDGLIPKGFGIFENVLAAVND